MRTFNIDSQSGVASDPLALKINKIELTNYQGKTTDINAVVGQFSIVESIYSPTLMLEIGIKESSNLMENFPIIGQEIITVTAKRTNLGEEEENEIELRFFVTEVPAYSRGNNRTEQVYIIKGISEHAYNSKFLKISRSYREPAGREIEKILIEDLKFNPDNFISDKTDISKSKGIINTQEPLSAIEFFRQTAYDNKGTPFFVFQRLDGNIYFTSLSTLTSKAENEPIRKYYLDKDNTKAPGTPAEYRQKLGRILSISSELNLSKIKQAINGAFASESNFLDWSTKTFGKRVFDFNADIDLETTLEGNTIFSKNISVNNLPLNKLSKARVEYLATNASAFSGFNNYGSTVVSNRYRSNAYYSLMETHTHDIRIPGDLRLGAGNKITIKFPRGGNPEASGETTFVDEYLSGDFIVTSCSHVLDDGKYYCDLRVKRDSFPIDLETEENI
tara:strand:- start:34 stop:1374 length:1341 start_codon:yes stop_codon:yes gene_type:complete